MVESKEKKEMLGPETSRSHYARHYSNFYKLYMHGTGLDIGYMGDSKDNIPVNDAVGIDKDTPNYDGKHLPQEDGSQDYIFASHMLEHIDAPEEYIQEWHQKLKVGGYLIIMVPHKFLYEKKENPPSRFNHDHKKFYTPAKLMQTIENALRPNSYRLELLRDNATMFDYSKSPKEHSNGAYEIELVLQKIKEPSWGIEDVQQGDAAKAEAGSI